MIEKPARAESAPTTSESSRGKKVADLSNNGDWEPLTSLKVEKGQKPPANTKIKFPNSSPKLIKSWADILAGVAGYLIEIGKISVEDCPMSKKEGAKQYLLHTKPFHPTGREFSSKRKIGKLWVNIHFDAPNTWKNSCWLLDNFDVSPSTVLVSTNRS